MSKITKILSLLGAVLALLAGGIAPANAESSTTLTATQFLASDGYKEFQAATKLGEAYIATQSGQELVMVTTMNVDGTDTVISNMTIQATKTRAKINMTVSGKSMTMYIIDGAFYVPGTEYKTMYGPRNVERAMNSLNGSYSKLVKMSAVPSEYESFNPGDLFDPNSPTSVDMLNESFAQLLSFFTFSDVVKTVNAEDATMTDYTFSMTMSLLGSSSTINQTYTLDSNSVMVEGLLSITSGTGASQMSSSTKLNFSVKNDLVIDAPDPTSVINESVIASKSNLITALDSANSKAKALVKKATELAKKSKAQVSTKHFTDAAKSLKYIVSKITNGVKLTSKVSGVSGNVCVTVVKGKTSTKNC